MWALPRIQDTTYYLPIPKGISIFNDHKTVAYKLQNINAARYYRYHDSIDIRFGIVKESLGIASIGYIQ